MADSESNTHDLAHFTCIWIIENVCESIFLSSPTFTVQAMDNTWWFLLFNSQGPVQSGISRCLVADGPESIEVKFELSIIGVNGQPLIKKLSCKQFSKYDELKFCKFADNDEVFVHKRAEFLPSDSLTVRCRMWKTGAEISKHEVCFARTILRRFRGSSLSQIKEFSTLRVGQKREGNLTSIVGEDIPLTLHYFIREEEDQQYVCIGMVHNRTVESLRGKIKICLLDAKEDIVYSVEEYKQPYSTLCFEDFFEKRKLICDKAALLPDDVLSFRFEYDMVTEIWKKIEKCLNSSESEESTLEVDKMDLVVKHDISKMPSSITEAFKVLLHEGALTDVSLHAGSKSFPAHKCILYARSPVFRAMFSGDIKEKTSKFVEITDVDEDTLRHLLSYVYTDEVGELEWRGATDLYKAADKYELLDLKRRCATFLKSDLSVCSVCAVLGVADEHRDHELRQAAQDFITRQPAEIFASDTWRSFIEENSKLAMETMERLLLNKYLE